MKPPPIVFVSYSHDSEEHSDWVLQLATRLRSNGVDAILDRWDLKLGQDLAAFMENGLSSSHRVLCICSQEYVAKADEGRGGVGYEKQIITAELLADLNQNWVIPVIRNNPQTRKLPRFLGTRLYIDFEEDRFYESKYEELLRALLDEPVLPVPELGKNPFETASSPTLEETPHQPHLDPEPLEPPPTERAYVPDTLTPYELWKLVSNKTDAVAPLEAGRYIGAWLPVPQAKLINVKQEQNGQMAVLVEVGGPMVITLRCSLDAERWRAALLLYDPGLPIAFNGRIVAFQNPLLAYEPHITLEDCELETASH